MTAHRASLVLIAGFIAADVSGMAYAQTGGANPPPGMSDTETDPERFAVTPIEGGILRVDRQTGAVSRCQETRGIFTCRLVPDDRATLEAEISRLMAENERLRLSAELREGAAPAAPQGETPQAATPEAATPDGEAETAERAPVIDPEDLDRAMQAAREVMRRFFDMVEDLRRDMERGERI